MAYDKKITCKTGEVVNSYEDYLQTFHWREFRKECFEASGNRCMKCKKKPKKGLQLHHKHYKTIGNESRHDVIPLCDSCHKIEHGINKPKPKKKKRDTGEFVWSNRDFILIGLLEYGYGQEFRDMMHKKFKSKTLCRRMYDSKDFKKMVDVSNIAKAYYAKADTQNK